MAPRQAVTTTARRAKRIIDSPSASSSETPTPPSPDAASSSRTRGAVMSAAAGGSNKRPPPPDDSEVEEEEGEEDVDDADGEDAEEQEDDAEGDDDAEGEEEAPDLGSEEGDVDMDRSRMSSIDVSEELNFRDVNQDDELAEDGSISPATNSTAPASALRIKLKVSGPGGTPTPAGRLGRVAAKKGAKKIKRAAEDELESDDELLLKDDEESIMSSRRSGSPSKLTARQRAKGNKDLQETLLQLPNELTGKKQVILTEAERQQKREETARRRKRQSEQKLQDEQDETINRLLRAQTSRSRAKLDNPSPGVGDAEGGEASGSGQVSPSRRVPLIAGEMIRWTSSISKDGDVLLRVAVPKDEEDWIALTPDQLSSPSVSADQGERKVRMRKPFERGTKKIAICTVDGCSKERKYRSTRNFELGGCGIEHLKEVDEALT
ncbi:hypothetical protein I317_04507 [Kwoniella heveanensis CBS 569]|nr:hypothetical protein I317_04507 [Kwoniella heveanensis CBS 569]